MRWNIVFLGLFSGFTFFNYRFLTTFGFNSELYEYFLFAPLFPDRTSFKAIWGITGVNLYSFLTPEEVWEYHFTIYQHNWVVMTLVGGISSLFFLPFFN